ncbi:Steroid delta-isomerase [gamma proteobacterium HdN1]|nr:Steroid delta-isomerase [gamma proteobacterium HdN1]
MDTAHKIKVVNQYIQAVSTLDLDLIREIYASNATVEDPVGSPRHEGIDAILAFYGRIKGVGVTLALKDTPKCAGNAVAFPFTATIGPTVMDIIDVFEFNEDGKVLSMKAYWGPENRK